MSATDHLDAAELLARCHRAYDLALRMTAERDHLRALITAWADAEWHVDIVTNGYLDRIDAYNDTCDALRKTVANVITVELGPKASSPEDVADALRKAVGR